MPVSYSQDTSLECPECQATFSADAWMIVDAIERPDLAARCRDGSIFAVVCPNGHAGTLSTPLLYNDPGKQLLVLATPPGVDEPQAIEIHGQLMARLTADLPEPLPDYFQETKVVPQEYLTMTLADDPEAAFAAHRAAQQEAAHLTTPEEKALAETLHQFIQATTWDESRNILQAHPELGTEEADAVLGKLIDAAGQAKDTGAEKIMEGHRELLHSVQRDGMDAAFAQVRASAESDAEVLPPDIMARLEELNVRTEEDFQRALREHPDLAEAIQNATAASNPGLAAIQELSAARSPQDVLRLVRAFPILLEDETLNQLDELIATEREHGAKEITRQLERCRQMLVEFKESGLSVEEWEQVEPQLQNPLAVELFKELAKLGVNSPQALEETMRARPDLREKWARVAEQTASDAQGDDAESPAPDRPRDTLS